MISQLAAHWPAAANPSAAARIRFGNISPSSTHTTGPQDIPKATTNRFAATSAMGPCAPLSCGTPSTCGAVPKMNAMVANVTAMPADPISSNGLRPILSISEIAINVVAILTIEVITVITKDWLSSKPTASHSTLE